MTERRGERPQAPCKRAPRRRRVLGESLVAPYRILQDTAGVRVGEGFHALPSILLILRAADCRPYPVKPSLLGEGVTAGDG